VETAPDRLLQSFVRTMKRIISILFIVIVPLTALAISDFPVSDDFDDNSFDTSKWSEYETSCVNSEANQQLEQVYSANTSGAECDTSTLTTSYNFDEMQVNVNLVQVASPGVDNIFLIGNIGSSYGDRAMWLCSSATCYTYIQSDYSAIAGCGSTYCSSESITPGANTYLKFREESGMFYFEYSTDAKETWNTSYSTPSMNIPFSLSSTRVVMSGYEYSGTGATTENTLIFDNFMISDTETSATTTTINVGSIMINNGSYIID